jgi:hypothetical protein
LHHVEPTGAFYVFAARAVFARFLQGAFRSPRRSKSALRLELLSAAAAKGFALLYANSLENIKGGLDRLER